MMNKAYRVVVFDWEGTLVDTLGGYVSAIEEIAKAHYCETTNIKKLRASLSFGLNKAIAAAFPEMMPHTYEAFLRDIQYYVATSKMSTPLMPGALELLQWLFQNGVILAVASNKGRTSLTKAIEQSGLSPLLTLTRSASETALKPNPEMLEDIIHHTGVVSSEVLMIGDSISDMEMAQTLNVDAIGFDADGENKDALLAAGAMMVFNDFQALKDFFDL